MFKYKFIQVCWHCYQEECKMDCLFMLTQNWPLHSCLWWHFSNMNSVWFLTESKSFRFSPCCLKRIMSARLVPRLWVPDILILLLFLDTQGGFLPSTVGQLISYIYILLLIRYIYYRRFLVCGQMFKVTIHEPASEKLHLSWHD